jgi:hypothetical protein
MHLIRGCIEIDRFCGGAECAVFFRCKVSGRIIYIYRSLYTRGCVGCQGDNMATNRWGGGGEDFNEGRKQW